MEDPIIPQDNSELEAMLVQDSKRNEILGSMEGNQEAQIVEQKNTTDAVKDLEPALEAIMVNTKPKEVQKIEIVPPTEDEGALQRTFFQMLRGQKGEKGDQGEKGEQGEQGEKGETGEQGIQGEQGNDGVDGKDGLDGLDGKDGKDGKDGRDGKDGKKGEKGNNGSPDTGRDIAKKLSDLLEDDRLSYKALKDTPEFFSQSRSGGGAGFLRELSDVYLPTVPTNGQVLTYDSTNKRWYAGTGGGGGGGTWGSITGTLSDQLDLQSALDAKQNDITGSDTLILYFDGANNPAGASGFSFNDVTGRVSMQDLTIANTSADKVLVTDALKAVTTSTTSSIELGYLTGVTSAIQTQLDAKQGLDAQLTSLAALSYAGNAGKFIRVNAGENAFELATVAGSGATTALDNLASVAINTSLISDTDNTDDLGSASIGWRTGYFATSILVPKIQFGGTTSSFPMFKRTTTAVNLRLADDSGDAGFTAGASTFSGQMALGANNITMTGSLATTGNRVTKGWFTDIESTNMPTVGGTSLTTVAQTFQNKTMTNSNNVLGGVTMTLGSDADGDIYYRASGVLTRLPKGTAGQILTMNGGATAPEWATGSGGGGLTVGTTTIASGTDTYVLYNNAGVLANSNILRIVSSVRVDISSLIATDAAALHYGFFSRNGSSGLSLDGGGWYAYDSYGQISFGITEASSSNKAFFTRYGRKGAVANLNAATLTLTQSHHTVTVEYTVTGAVTITLPAASASYNTTYDVGAEYIILDTGAQATANNITVNRAGTDTIITTVTGQTAATIVVNGGGLRLQAINATTWKATRFTY